MKAIELRPGDQFLYRHGLTSQKGLAVCTRLFDVTSRGMGSFVTGPLMFVAIRNGTLHSLAPELDVQLLNRDHEPQPFAPGCYMYGAEVAA